MQPNFFINRLFGKRSASVAPVCNSRTRRAVHMYPCGQVSYAQRGAAAEQAPWLFGITHPLSVRLSTLGVLRGWKTALLRSVGLLPCLALVLVSACSFRVPEDRDVDHQSFLERARSDDPNRFPGHAAFLERAKRD